MIVTVTPNPALDRTMAFDVVRTGVVNRAVTAGVEPSGKGVNVTRALAMNGVAARAVVPLGGAEGQQLAELLDAEGVDYVAVPLRHSVRVNVSVVTADGVVTKLNEQGPALDTDEVDAVVAAVERCAVGATWIVGSGTLARGMDTDFYARLGEGARAIGARFALDTSGPPLRAGLATRPDLLKPNREELAELVGSPLRTLGDVVAAAGKVRSETDGAVVVSLGPDGAVLVDEAGVMHGEAPVGRVRSAVGAAPERHRECREGRADPPCRVIAGAALPKVIRRSLLSTPEIVWVMQKSSEARPRPGGYPRGVEPRSTLHPVNGLSPGAPRGYPSGRAICITHFE